MSSKDKKDRRPQLTAAEVEERIKIDASPEAVARAVMSSVEVRVVRGEKSE